MTDTTFEKELILEDIGEDGILKGHLKLNVSDTIAIDRITATIYIEAKGRMASQKDVLMTIIVNSPTLIDAFQDCKIPFEIDISNFRINSYKGQNMSLLYKCELKIDIDEEDLEKIDRSIFTKVKSFVTNDRSFKLSDYFEVKNTCKPYEIVEDYNTFKMQFNIQLAIIMGLIIGVIYVALTKVFETLHFAYIIPFIILSSIAINKIIGLIIGKITLATFKDKDSFLCSVQKTKLFAPKNQCIYYEINEKVVDKRGTSTSTLIENLFTSEKKSISDYKESNKILFEFPVQLGLHSTTYADASIIWQMTIEGTYLFNIKIKYKSDFEVIQKQSPLNYQP